MRGSGDVVERTAAAVGDVIRSRKGDFVLTVDPQLCSGMDVRVVIEAKDRACSWREIREELDAARRNRAASVAMAVFTPGHAPSGVAPFDMRFGHAIRVRDGVAIEFVTRRTAEEALEALPSERPPRSSIKA